MFYVYRADLDYVPIAKEQAYKVGFLWAISKKVGVSTIAIDKATQFDTWEEADFAAKAAGWKRYVILNSDPPVSCPCREMIDPENF